MKSLEFTPIVEGDKDGYYAYYPELKGCQTEGRTVEEALANLREAAELYLETLSPQDLETLGDSLKTILSTLRVEFLRWLRRLTLVSASENIFSSAAEVLRAQAPRLTAVEAEKLLLRAGFVQVRSRDSHRMYRRHTERIVVPFHGGRHLHPKIVLHSECCRISAELN